MNVTVEDIKRDPQTVIDRVLDGETVVLLVGHHAVAEIRPIGNAVPRPRPFGLAAGAFVVPDDFDDPLPDDVIKTFEG
ncbi:MAG TPA: type II toxin-antitoxin system Phd/YefM family antitoxin [Thermoanaerobaculia bacterium]|nr:type II toxin-antitoxin system Phd/YefM family antitoxin [Thermoanaerobaculia bacterium]